MLPYESTISASNLPAPGRSPELAAGSPDRQGGVVREHTSSVCAKLVLPPTVCCAGPDGRVRRPHRPPHAAHGGSHDRDGFRHLLRPVRLRDRLGPVPGVEATARRATALLQRPVRLLRVEPVRGRRPVLARLGDLHLEQGNCPGAHQERHGDPSRLHHLRGPARPPPPPPPPGPRLHATQHQRPGAQGARVLRAEPRSPRRRGPLRLHRGPRRPNAHAHHRDAAGHPRAGPGGHPRPHRRGTAADGEHHARRRDQVRREHESRAASSRSTSSGGRVTPRTTS